MPFTPFHFGPGLLGKSLAPRVYSWTAFVAANVLIDCESLYYLNQNAWPIHRRLHTFVGAALAGAVTAALMLAACRLVPKFRGWLAPHSPTVRAEASTLGIVVGAMLGALTHPLLDGLMHPDIEPFQPWSARNPLRGLIGLEALHLGCLVAGMLGAILLFVRRRR